MIVRRLLPFVAVLPLLAACGGAGRVGEAVRPNAVTGAQAMGESLGTSDVCSATATSEPLVIDWKTSERTDLELGMRDGAASPRVLRRRLRPHGRRGGVQGDVRARGEARRKAGVEGRAHLPSPMSAGLGRRRGEGARAGAGPNAESRELGSRLCAAGHLGRSHLSASAEHGPFGRAIRRKETDEGVALGISRCAGRRRRSRRPRRAPPTRADARRHPVLHRVDFLGEPEKKTSFQSRTGS